MSDQNHGPDPGLIWRDQPEERVPVNLEQIVNRQTQELSTRTRWEILMSVGSALLLVGVVAWRLEIVHEPRLELGLSAAVAWMAISLYCFRRRLFWREASLRDAVAATCLEYYRTELERRRDHLRNVWLWYGPVLLASVILIGVLTGRVNIAFQPLQNALPLIVLLAAWVGFGLWRRRLQARSLQREIDELAPFGDGSNKRSV
jgi:FtsH-binding integral membrane protein